MARNSRALRRIMPCAQTSWLASAATLLRGRPMRWWCRSTRRQPRSGGFAAGWRCWQYDDETVMHWPTTLFIAAVAATTAVELWLAARQIAAVTGHRDRIPEPFAGRLSAEDHRKAADYTVAKARLGMVNTLIDAAVRLGLTVGGGIAAMDALWRHTGWGEP